MHNTLLSKCSLGNVIENNFKDEMQPCGDKNVLRLHFGDGDRTLQIY